MAIAHLLAHPADEGKGVSVGSGDEVEKWGTHGNKAYLLVISNINLACHSMKQIFTILFILVCHFAYGQTYSSGDRQGYFDSNFGVAVYEGFLYPGCSFLGGVRTFWDERHFVEIEAGFAFPTAVTAKSGVGHVNPRTGGTTSFGIRPWPLHLYLQKSFPTKRCEREISKRKMKRLERKGMTRQNLLCSDWYFTIEAGTGQEISSESALIVSFGHRLFYN
jgi:hypothetical protein